MWFIITKAGIDITYSLVHSHVYETSAQAVMGEHQHHPLQQLVEPIQSLDRNPTCNIKFDIFLFIYFLLIKFDIKIG